MIAQVISSRALTTMPMSLALGKGSATAALGALALGFAARHNAGDVTGRDVALFDFTLLIFEYSSPDCGSAFDDDTLRRRTMPIPAVIGERDAMLDSYQTRQRLEETTPHAKLRLLPEAGQLVANQTATVLDVLHSPDLDRRDG
jgi:hypothetical protein